MTFQTLAAAGQDASHAMSLLRYTKRMRALKDWLDRTTSVAMLRTAARSWDVYGSDRSAPAGLYSDIYSGSMPRDSESVSEMLSGKDYVPLRAHTIDAYVCMHMPRITHRAGRPVFPHSPLVACDVAASNAHSVRKLMRSCGSSDLECFASVICEDAALARVEDHLFVNMDDLSPRSQIVMSEIIRCDSENRVYCDEDLRESLSARLRMRYDTRLRKLLNRLTQTTECRVNVDDAVDAAKASEACVEKILATCSIHVSQEGFAKLEIVDQHAAMLICRRYMPALFDALS